MSQSDNFFKIYTNLAKAQGYLDFYKALPEKPDTSKPLSKQQIKGASYTPPKEYHEGGAKHKTDYADPNSWKYPIDNYKHTRAAISYFGKPANYGMYKPAERRTIASRIIKAAKKFGIDVSDDWKSKFSLSKKK